MRIIVGIVATAALIFTIVGAVAQAQSTHQRWDGWLHDWWHSDWAAQHGWVHTQCRAVTEAQRLPDGQVVTRVVEWC
jgi:hypothetical protein